MPKQPLNSPPYSTHGMLLGAQSVTAPQSMQRIWECLTGLVWHGYTSVATKLSFEQSLRLYRQSLNSSPHESVVLMVDEVGVLDTKWFSQRETIGSPPLLAELMQEMDRSHGRLIISHLRQDVLNVRKRLSVARSCPGACQHCRGMRVGPGALATGKATENSSCQPSRPSPAVAVMLRPTHGLPLTASP